MARIPIWDERLNDMFEELYDSLTTFLGVVPSTTKFTPLGGIASKFINKTGSASVKGCVVTASSSVDNAVALAGVDQANAIGVFLDSGVADGDEAWVAWGGVAEVYFSGSATRGHMARLGVASDTGEQNGQAVSEIYPTSPFATDKHFAEIGHVLASRTGAGLAKVILHFN